MTKVQFIDCIGKIKVNNKVQEIKNNVDFFKQILGCIDRPDTFVKQVKPDLEPIVVKIKEKREPKIQDLLKYNRIKKINKNS